MSRTLIKAAEAQLPVNTGTATSFSSATAVRLVNTSSSADHLVTVVAEQSGAVVRGTVEVLEKQPSHCVFAANNAVKGAQVGFTN